MKKLQNKTFLLITSILTIFILTILIIFNVVIYSNEYKELNNKIIRISNAHEKFTLNYSEFKNPLFMDMEVYVVSFDRYGKVSSVSNYTNDGLSTKEIIELAKKNRNKFGKVGNLYFNKYIFSSSKDGALIIINNTNVNRYLIANLYESIILFILLEIIILYISYILTKWIVKPVNESFIKQKQFIYDASHELKTPIAIIMASAESLEENPTEVKWVDNIKSESERMNKLVIDLLELSKSEETSNVVLEEKNLSKIINNKALSFESLMFESNLNLVTDIDENIIFKCDEEKIKELLSILVDNAIKHAYKRSKITVSLKKVKDVIVLSVKNRGEEIKEEERNKIFERFYRVDKSRNRDENRYGLGLAIAKNIVSNHNGKIYVECMNGYTTFKVEFKNN